MVDFNNIPKVLKSQFITGLLIVLALSGLNSCSSVKYSMSGASISPDVKSLSVQYFPNRALIVNPELSQKFTDGLREKCKAQTTLTILTQGGDVNFEGEITGYDVRPTAIQGNDVAAKNRLTITVRVKFTNTVEPKYSFDSSFSRFKDYESNKDLSSVAGELIPLIIDELTEDIFNKAFVNW